MCPPIARVSATMAAADLLVGGDRREIDCVDDPLVRLYRAVGHVDAEIALRTQHSKPQLLFQNNLVLG
jgi:hypothetical protein